MRRKSSIVVAALAPMLAGAPGVFAQQRSETISGDRLTGFVLPIEPQDADIRLRALRGWAWTVDDTKRLLLEGDVTISIGSYAVRAPAAAVWLNRIPSAGGLINQISIYFERADGSATTAALSVEGRQLLVTGSARGAVELNVALLRRVMPPRGALLREGERRLAAYLQGLVLDPPALMQHPQQHSETPPVEPVPIPGAPMPPATPAPSPPVSVVVPEPPGPPLFVPQGTVWFSWGDLRVTPGEQENVIIASGSVVAQYITDRGDERWSQLTMSAQRAVVFTDPGPVEEFLTGRLRAESIRGIYLEGNVIARADQGDYTLRAPQIYYDFRTNQAIVMEAILRTYDRQFGVPIYARAEEMRQIAANQWTARRATVSTSEFFTPHFAVGARRVTITERSGDDPAEDSSIHLDTEDMTLELGGLPILYWPKFSGTIQDIPLRGINVGGNSSEGVAIQTRWDAFTLLGLEKPDGLDVELRADGFTKRGPAGGAVVTYDRGSMTGAVDLYYLNDDGTDRTSSGRDVKPDNQNRGVALWEHRLRLSRDWTVQAQAAYISDETFITTWRDEDFQTRREYEYSAYIKNLRGNSALTSLFKYDGNDFISNSYLLASRAYQVSKLGEATYRRYGDSLFDTITYSGETRLSRVQLNFQEGTPAELGVRGAAFGIAPTDSIPDALRAAGFDQKWRVRFDSRHEFAVPFRVGAVNFVPFAVARLTAYDESFDGFGGNDDKTRAFGAAGLRVNAQIQRIDNTVENRLLDLHRLRHIVEPRATLWYGATNIDLGELPVYDQAVEAIGGGTVVEVGLRNTWQTKRGGPGRWRSEDVLQIDASYVYNSNDVNTDSPNPQFFDYRPEYSQFGEHVHTTMMFLPSDHFTIVGEATYDLDADNLTRGSIGTEIRHSPLLSTFIEYRYIDAGNNELLETGVNYLLTPKYRVSVRPQWDFEEQEFRAVSLVVTRKFPDFSLTVRVRHDEIQDQTTIGASLDLVEF